MADDPAPLSLLGPFHGERPPAPAWFEAAIARAPERSRIPVEGVGIELLTWGEVGKPGLLFLHGNGAHADWWSFIAPSFADDWRVAAISWSGAGAAGVAVAGLAGAASSALAAGLNASTLMPPTSSAAKAVVVRYFMVANTCMVVCRGRAESALETGPARPLRQRTGLHGDQPVTEARRRSPYEDLPHHVLASA